MSRYCENHSARLPAGNLSCHTTLRFHLGYAGYFQASEHYAIRNGRRQKIRFYALWGLIEHPERGLILYDTGLTQRFYFVSRKCSARLRARLARVVVGLGDEVRAQLERAGIKPADIKHIILTHFHADHAGGLRDFPNANIYASQEAIKQFRKNGCNKERKLGVFPDLFPEDLWERVVPVEQYCTEVPDPFFGYKHDLFSDGTLQLLPLYGRAAGQLGVRINTPRNSYLLASDACWMREQYLENKLPHPLMRLLLDSWPDYLRTLARLRAFHRAFPSVRIIPSHCRATTDPLVSREISFDRL